MTGDRASASTEETERAQFGRHVQSAAGVVAARRRGDPQGAATLLAGMGDDAERAMAFYVVADLALNLLAGATGESMDVTVQRLTLAVETGLARP